MRSPKRFSLINLFILSAVSILIWYVARSLGAPPWAGYVGAVVWGLVSPFHIFVRK